MEFWFSVVAGFAWYMIVSVLVGKALKRHRRLHYPRVR